ARTKTILLVDDEPSILETMALILKMRGYQVATASTGEEAIEKALEIRPDVLLSDVYMPGSLNGIASSIVIQESLPDVGVVLFSGHADVKDLVAESAKDGHVFIVLAKPVPPEDLFAALENASRGTA